MDLLVDPTPETTLMDIAKIQVEVARLLNVTVDVLTPRALPDKFRDQILKEARAGMNKKDILRIPPYLEYIVEAIERIHLYVKDCSEVDFLDDKKLRMRLSETSRLLAKRGT